MTTFAPELILTNQMNAATTQIEWVKCGGLPMKIFHISDWHLGRSLYCRKRYEKFSAFLDWLENQL